MEDMYKSLNKTIQKLQNMSSTAELQDRKQQERIRTLEGVVENINNSMWALQSQMDIVHEVVRSLNCYIYETL